MDRTCELCGRKLGEEETRYVVRIEVMADVSPVLDDRLSKEEVEAAIADLLEKLTRLARPEIEAEVYQEMVYVLCPACRKVFAADPFSSRTLLQ